MVHTRYILLQYLFYKNDPLVNVAMQRVFTLVYNRKGGQCGWTTNLSFKTMWLPCATSSHGLISAIGSGMACHSATRQPWHLRSHACGLRTHTFPASHTLRVTVCLLTATRHAATCTCTFPPAPPCAASWNCGKVDCSDWWLSQDFVRHYISHVFRKKWYEMKVSHVGVCQVAINGHMLLLWSIIRWIL